MVRPPEPSEEVLDEMHRSMQRWIYHTAMLVICARERRKRRPAAEEEAAFMARCHNEAQERARAIWDSLFDEGRKKYPPGVAQDLIAEAVIGWANEQLPGAPISRPPS